MHAAAPVVSLSRIALEDDGVEVGVKEWGSEAIRVVVLESLVDSKYRGGGHGWFRES